MKDKIKTIIARYDELNQLLTEPSVMNNQDKLKETAREHSQLADIVEKGRKYLSVYQQIEDDEEILAGDDADLKEIVQEELADLKEQKHTLEAGLKVLLLPKDPNDDKNTIVEIRAGTGGEEAALFAADLYRMYIHFAERNNW
ncbi:MAG TPA: PCRF domain-containing protein, partial [Candidatus Marinimicrobia bacterium]|nr:PCRF domain-containing protein [Candidatus Neomarinimicrobiota bacterium]